MCFEREKALVGSILQLCFESVWLARRFMDASVGRVLVAEEGECGNALIYEPAYSQKCQ